METPKLVVIVGTTASGKSDLAIELAEKFNGEIICADSRTVYKDLNIGTAKPSANDQSKIRHHLLDVVSPSESFTAADFKKLANNAIEEISSRGKLPIMVGGTGLYIDSVLFNYEFAPKNAERDLINPRHLSREVEVKKNEQRPNTFVIGIEQVREKLRGRIESRVDAMVEEGFINEVKRLSEQYGWDIPALQAPGYKAFREYLNGTVDLETAKALFVKNDLNLAKRQRTWFKRNKSIHWVNNRDSAVDLVTTYLSK